MRRDFSTISIGAIALLTAQLTEQPAFAAQAGRSPVKVFLLWGQSNMEGKGRLSELEQLAGSGRPEFRHLKTRSGSWVVRRDVWIDYKGRKGGLSIGYGTSPAQIGPELQIGHILGDHLDNQVLLIKCSWGGRSLYKEFRPPSAGGNVGEAYSDSLGHIKRVLGDIKGHFPDYNGRGYEIAGFLWFQGWNDMINGDATNEYEDNFVHLVQDLRKEFGVPDMPVVIAETGNCGNMKFRKAQETAASRPEMGGKALFVPTGDCARVKPVGYHWNSNAESYFVIGTKMGKAMAKLVPTIGAKELTPGTRPIYEKIGAGMYGSAYVSLLKLGEGKSDKEKDLVVRLKDQILKRVDATVGQIKSLDEQGDYYRASQLLAKSKPKFKGIDTFDEFADPLVKEYRSSKKRSVIKAGAQYFYVMELAKKSRSRQVIMALGQIAKKKPESLYSKAARIAFTELQDSEKEADASKYLMKAAAE